MKGKTTVMKIDQPICNDWTLSHLRDCLKACGLKIKIASEILSVSVALCAGVSLYLHVFLSVCFCSCEHKCVLFVLPCTCVLWRAWALSVSRSCPPCQNSGIYKSRQWKTDHQASSCRTSILPKASKDSLQHALLIPMLLQTKFSAAFPWFILACCGVCVSGRHGCGNDCRVDVSSEIQLCCLWIRALPLASLNDSVPCVRCLHFLWCAVCHL